MVTRREFSMMLFMADTLNDDHTRLRGESGQFPSPGVHSGSKVPMVVESLNRYVWQALRRAQQL